MQFDQTKTYLNLARGFAGESQAGMRYQLIARTALKQGYDCIENIDIDAGYPFHMGDISQALKFAAKDEREEHERIYSTFAKEAKEEGFDDVAALFNLVANVEKRHEQVFTYLANAFETGTLYKNESPILYVCADCGYMQTATRAWDICPLCKASQGEVYLHIPYEKEKL